MPESEVKQPQTFEESLARLQEIVRSLEGGDVPLESSLKLFEEGVQLARACAKRLDEIEGKLEVLQQRDDGQLELQPFDEPGGSAEAAGS